MDLFDDSSMIALEPKGLKAVEFGIESSHFGFRAGREMKFRMA
jgi:hypothetical protein